MYRILGVLFFTFFTHAGLFAQSSKQIQIILEPKNSEKEPSVLVTVKFVGDSSGITELILPDRWASEKELYKDLVELKLSNDRQVLNSLPEKPHVYQVKHQSNEMIQLSYRVKQTWKKPMDRRQYFRAVIDHSYIHLIGSSFLVLPKWENTQNLEVDFQWKLANPAWKVATSFFAGKQAEKFTTTLGALKSAIYLAGDFNVRNISVESQNIVIAERGSWKFSMEEFDLLLQKIFKSHRDFWNDHDFPFFLVSMIPTDEKEGSLGGSGFTNSFALFPSKDMKNSESIKGLLSHELLHTWLGHKIGGADKIPEELNYWWTEGFTEHYTNVLNLRNHLMTYPEYLEKINEILYRYHFSEQINAKNNDLIKNYWKDEFFKKLPYQRGHLLALNWNAKIRKHNNKYSFDNIVQDIFAAVKKEGLMPTHFDWHKASLPYLPNGIKVDIEKFIDDGQTIAMDGNALGECAKLVEKKMPKFDLGFNLQETRKNNQVVGLSKTSQAYLSGVREGMKVKRMSIYHNILQQSLLVVSDEKGLEKEIKFFPHGESKVVPQFELESSVNISSCSL